MFKPFLGASEHRIKNLYGVAPVGELDSDEFSLLVVKVAEVKKAEARQ